MTRMAKWLALASCVALVCCATSKPVEEPKKNPIAREPGKPLSLKILAAQYTLPERFDVDDHHDDPGSYFLSYVDRVTRCEGFFDFETTSDAGAHEGAVQQRLGQMLGVWEQQHVGVARRDEAVKILEQDARVAVFDVAGSSMTARVALADRHYADQSLSLQCFVYCADPGLLTAQLEAAVGVVNSQKR